ncbi:hypothetical protein KY495_23160 [Massilia sp. PAMC28688]|uniref:hypothetical protein n=1 Tax=Massilia sp. PAMC28688 TaxID=2861283 RepID=UPI001C639F73|nr:hypothetical protein [Massilia sp. PAMC28688]QYF93519.1 hypothetical protein KY495_23160 [Massilia sp. PAMC28688]
MPNLSQSITLIKTLLAMPVAHLRFERHLEPANVLSTYRYYTKRHPKYFVIGHKSWGAALIDLQQCTTRAAYLERIKGKNAGAYHARRARMRGYHLMEIDRNNYVDAIHDINTSVDQRQGRPMDAHYQEKQLHFEVLANYRCFGVFSAANELAAYATLGRFGNFSAFSQLMGYRNNDGIMHLLVSDIVGQLIDEGQVRYAMYDTFFGALPGLQQFKTMLGFEPYRARYSLQ